MNAQYKVSFLDLATPHRELEEKLVSILRLVLETAAFVGGPMVEEFEKEFARFCGTGFCVGVGSGTDALRFALIASGIQPGDTVITVPNTFVATAEAITQAGASVEFVDIDERTYNMDAVKLDQYLTTQCHKDGVTGKLVSGKTGRPVAAVIPVHLYGQMADMDAIQEVAERHGIQVIEDACQAHGAAYHSGKRNCWHQAGSIGRAAAFSFYPGKNLGACGEAGAVTTNDREVADRVRMLRDHGQQQKYQHEIEGYNGRLDALQAGFLLAKLQYLPQWNQKRRAIARRYDDLFGRYPEAVTVPYNHPQSTSACHLYVIRVNRRDDLQASLNDAKIGTQIHYPIPIHLQKAYRFLGYHEGDFPVAEKASREILSLPMYPDLNENLQKLVAEKVIESVTRYGDSVRIPAVVMEKRAIAANSAR